jgi:hypothetical protein
MFAFDLLFLDGTDLRRLPLADRKARLQALVRRRKRIEGDGATIVSKRRDLPYRSGRSAAWLKIPPRLCYGQPSSPVSDPWLACPRGHTGEREPRSPRDQLLKMAETREVLASERKGRQRHTPDEGAAPSDDKTD